MNHAAASEWTNDPVNPTSRILDDLDGVKLLTIAQRMVLVPELVKWPMQAQEYCD
jgi:hypothetical protein